MKDGVKGQELSDLRIDVLHIDVVVLLAVQDLHSSFLSHPIAHLSGVNPNCQVSWQVFYHIRDGVPTLPRSSIQDGVSWVSDLETPVS